MTIKYFHKEDIEILVCWTDTKLSGKKISDFPNAVKIGRGKFDKDDFSVWKLNEETVVTSRFSQNTILTMMA